MNINKLILPFLLLCSCSFAKESVFVKEEHIPLHSTFDIGPVYQRYALDADGIGEFHGNTWGGVASYSYAVPKGIFAQLGVEASSGTLNGQTDASTISQIEFLFTEKLGYNFIWGPKEKFTFTPFLGFNYLWWRQHLDIVGFDLLRYTYTKPYIPFGILNQFNVNDKLSFGINYTYLFSIITFLSIDVTIGSQWFLKRENDHLLEFPITIKPRPWFHVKAIPFYRSIKMGPSTAVTFTGLRLGVLPESYQIWGGKIDFSWLF